MSDALMPPYTLFQLLMAAAVANLTLIAGPNGSRSRGGRSRPCSRACSSSGTAYRPFFGARCRPESEADGSPSAPQLASARAS